MSDLKTAEAFGSFTLVAARVPERFQKAAKRDFAGPDPSRLDHAASRIADDAENAIIHGLQGRGKSHYAAALLRELAERFMLETEGVERVALPGNPLPRFLRRDEEGAQIPLGFTARWVFVPKLLDDARAAVGKDEDGPFAKLREYDILILDDLGMHRATGWVVDSLYAMVGSRYDAMRPTITTSNLDPKGLAETLDPRLASRLVGGYRISLDGPDRRLAR